MNQKLAPEIKKYFEGRRLLIATKHGKEIILGPALEHALGVQVFLLPGYDTDQFGTFSGEVERRGDAVSTLRKKIRLAMDLAKADLAVGSEGSFGPHPQLGWIAADQEWLMLIDARHDLEITAQTISTETNFAQQPIASPAELDIFARQVGFPAHGLILKAETASGPIFEKAIGDEAYLHAAYHALRQRSSTITIETDMRAQYNPMRQKVIAATCSQLLNIIASPCPQCGAPGFTVTSTIPGLPCRWCGTPTTWVLRSISTCRKCTCRRETEVDSKADPQNCPQCNP